MLIVDAAALFEVVTNTRVGSLIRDRLSREPELAAPHVIDVEVLGVIRRDRILGLLDPTAAQQAIDDLWAWPGERFEHRALLHRAWELRDNVRGWDAFYVALAEALNGTLLTLDGRLSRAPGVRCAVEVIDWPGRPNVR
jgi:predicted nucleic acid-binding protein